jgi:hypothetical protein
MPLDAMTADPLADIDRTKPLSIHDTKRIIRAARAAGLLAMDHAAEFRELVNRTMPYLTPHGAVDAFLGPENRGSSCPCRLLASSRLFLDHIDDLHRDVLFWRAVRPMREPRARSEFDRLLAD